MSDSKRHDIERDLVSLYRRRGELIPLTPDEVRIAESSKDESRQLPQSLANPPLLKHVNVRRRPFWTNSSVLLLNAPDPIEAVTQKAREVVLHAIEQGWTGPPYDPTQLAEFLRIQLVPNDSVPEAKTKWAGNGFRIEFNPLRPPARTRFSLAHEIGHTLFSDCAQAVRHRGFHTGATKDEWQLEMLCNIAASEILMPVGSLPKPTELKPSVEAILNLRKTYQVSAESVLLRLLHLTAYEAFGFAAHFDATVGQYRLDYLVRSPSFSESLSLHSGSLLPKSARARDCTGIRHTAHGEESWFSDAPRSIEYLGVAPFPTETLPRVLGLVRWTDKISAQLMKFEQGDATRPHSSASPTRMIVQVVNDKGLSWGPGFSQAVRKKWPHAQRDFTHWAEAHRSHLKLGAVRLSRLEDGLFLVNLVAQHGYGESPKPRIRYSALEQCLNTTAQLANEYQSSVHMPRIGSGQAGGRWPIIEEIIRQTLCSRGIEVTVYDLPNSSPRKEPQGHLFGPITHDQFV